MKRKGHIGMTLLAFAPVAYLLVSDGKLLLAALCWFGIQAVEPLPDRDFHLPILTHRGVSHSLLGVFVVGGILGGAGWLLGGHGFELLSGLLSTLVGIWDWLLGVLPELSASVLAGLVPNIPPDEIVTTLQRQAGGSMDRSSFAMFGFFVGAYGVLAHLLGDMITIQGIKPFLPFSHWRLSLSSLRADSPTANSALFGVGMIAIALVVVATVPGAIVGGVTADLSPVDVAGGQSTNTTGNQTANLSANTTATPNANTTANQSQNATKLNTTVVFANQTVNGSTVTVQRATLPNGGFLTLHGSDFSTAGVLDSSAIAVSPYLKPGSHTNITLRANHSPPGGTLNRTVLNKSGTYGVVAYQDTNNSQRFEFLTADTDGPYIVGNSTNRTVAADTGRVIIRGSRADPTAPDPPSATVTFPNQRSTDSSVTVRSVRLPDGGFVAVHTASYQSEPLSSTIGVSRYLPAGNYQNVSVQLTEPIQRNQTLVAIPTRDTNDTQTYDYVSSDGFHDVAYTANGEAVTDRASVSVRDGTATAVSSSMTIGAGTSTSVNTPGPTTEPTATGQPAAGNASESEAESGGVGAWIASNTLLVGVVVVVVLAVLPTLLKRS